MWKQGVLRLEGRFLKIRRKGNPLCGQMLRNDISTVGDFSCPLIQQRHMRPVAQMLFEPTAITVCLA